MFNRHVTHLLTRYVNGTLRPRQNARVINHVRSCDACRMALAREERVARDIQRELPQAGSPRNGQLAGVWADVLREIDPSKRRRLNASTLFSGVTVLVVVGMVIAMALPLLVESGIRVEAAPQQARPNSTASPTPGITETDEAAMAVTGSKSSLSGDHPLPQATIAFVSEFSGATPAPIPQLTVSPEAVQGGARW